MVSYNLRKDWSTISVMLAAFVTGTFPALASPPPAELFAAMDSNFSAVHTLSARVTVANLQPTGILRNFTVDWTLAGRKKLFSGVCDAGVFREILFSFNGFHSKELVNGRAGRISTSDRSSLEAVYIHSHPLLAPYISVAGSVRHQSIRRAVEAGNVELVVRADEEQIGSSQCVVLEARAAADNSALISWWLDPSTGYQPRAVSDRLAAVQDIEYIEIGGIWVPIAGIVWYALNSDTGIQSYWFVELVPETIRLNEPVDDSLFDVTFPADAMIHDEFADEWMVVAESYSGFREREVRAVGVAMQQDSELDHFAAKDLRPSTSTWKCPLGLGLMFLAFGFSGFRLIVYGRKKERER